MGVDLVDLDYTKACQVKKYEKSKITWSHLCKFKTYAFDILATTKTAKIDELGEKKLITPIFTKIGHFYKFFYEYFFICSTACINKYLK